MAGFGESKKAQKALKEAEKLAATPAHVRTDEDPYAELRNELQTLAAQMPKTHIFMGLIGHENTGKTAIVLAAFQQYCDENKSGRQSTLDEFVEINEKDVKE